VTDLVLDPTRSRVRIHTFAEGLFARLAHDLELVCEGVSGSATRQEGGQGTAALSVPLSGLRVTGVLKDGRVDESVLSAGDRRDVVEKVHREVFHARGDAAVRIAATHEGEATRVRLILPNGREVSSTVHPELRDSEGSLHVQARLDVSLSAIGSDVVKGPMGAFRVKDRVEVRVELAFSSSPT
jgi:hypothetical protein